MTHGAVWRYIQPDPMLSNESEATVGGLPASAIASNGSDGHAVAKSMGWQEAHDIVMRSALSARPMLQDGPSVYGYAKTNPLHGTDPLGLMKGGIGGGKKAADACLQSTSNNRITPIVLPHANDNKSIPFCYGTVHSIGAYGVVNCAYTCDNGLAFMGFWKHVWGRGILSRNFGGKLKPMEVYMSDAAIDRVAVLVDAWIYGRSPPSRSVLNLQLIDMTVIIGFVPQNFYIPDNACYDLLGNRLYIEHIKDFLTRTKTMFIDEMNGSFFLRQRGPNNFARRISLEKFAR